MTPRSPCVILRLLVEPSCESRSWARRSAVYDVLRRCRRVHRRRRRVSRRRRNVSWVQWPRVGGFLRSSHQHVRSSHQDCLWKIGECDGTLEWAGGEALGWTASIPPRPAFFTQSRLAVKTTSCHRWLTQLTVSNLGCTMKILRRHSSGR